jgi:uncharacterized membrane protein YcfT
VRPCVMSPKTVVRMEFFSCILLSILFGAWLFWTLQNYLDDDLTIAWIILTVFFAAAVGFDVYKVQQKLSTGPNNSKPTVPPSHRPF